MRAGVIVVLLAVWGYWSMPLPRPGDAGFYTWNGTIWCTTRSSCIHEVGHALDDQAGWISGSTAFVHAVETNTNLRVRRGNGSPDATALKELYAQMLAGSGGRVENMPIPFRTFYDWDTARRMIEKYAPGT